MRPLPDEFEHLFLVVDPHGGKPPQDVFTDQTFCAVKFIWVPEDCPFRIFGESVKRAVANDDARTVLEYDADVRAGIEQEQRRLLVECGAEENQSAMALKRNGYRMGLRRHNAIEEQQ